MAGEIMLINPRRRRRSRVRRTRSHAKRPRRVRRRRHALVANPHRRRRAARRVARRGRRRVHHRNPRMPFGVNLPAVLGGGAGFVLTNWGAGQLAKMLPSNWGLDANLTRIGSKAVVGIAAPMLLRRWLPRGVGAAMAIGGGIAVAVDIFATYLAPSLGLSDYDTGVLSDYQPGMLSGYGDPTRAEGLSDSAYGGSAY